MQNVRKPKTPERVTIREKATAKIKAQGMAKDIIKDPAKVGQALAKDGKEIRAANGDAIGVTMTTGTKVGATVTGTNGNRQAKVNRVHGHLSQVQVLLIAAHGKDTNQFRLPASLSLRYLHQKLHQLL